MPLESSPGSEPQGSELDVNAAGSSDAGGVAADSPAADKVVETPTLLESVDRALKGEGAEDPTDSENPGKDIPAPDASKKEAEATAGETKVDPTDEELKEYSPRAQDRIRELVARRKDVEEERDSFKPKAENFDQLTDYMSEHSITPEHLNNALAITSQINSGDFTQALKTLKPVYEELLSRSGEVIPDDLQEQVRLGYITEAHARDLHKSRTEAANATERERASRERGTAEKAQREQAESVHRMATAADTWAKGKASSDPDWNLKQQAVAEQVELMLSRSGPKGFPDTNEKVIALSEEALKVVEDRLKVFKPKPAAIQRGPSGQFASPNTVAASPKTLDEAIDMALAKTAVGA